MQAKPPRDEAQAGVLASVVSAVKQDTKAVHVNGGVIFIGRKGKNQNAQTVVSMVTGRTPAVNLAKVVLHVVENATLEQLSI
jgi:hypothetical protein